MAVLREGGVVGHAVGEIETAGTIYIPEARRFLSYQHYIATNVRELAHATEAPQRLAIDYGAKILGNEAFAKGELYAAMVGAQRGADYLFVAMQAGKAVQVA